MTCELGVVIVVHADGDSLGALRLEARVVLVAEACAQAQREVAAGFSLMVFARVRKGNCASNEGQDN